MRGVRSLWWLVLLLPLATPAPSPTLVAGHAHALAEASPGTDPPASPAIAGPFDDGIRDVRSWLIPPPPQQAPPAREWGPGGWNPIWQAPGVGESPLDGSSLETTPPPASTPSEAVPAPERPATTPEPEPTPSPGPAPAPTPSPEPAPDPLPGSDAGSPPPAGPPPEASPEEVPSSSSCLLCWILDMPRRARIL